MKKAINRAAVLGAGTMGATIAAHLANAGVPTLLLDIPATDGDDRNAIVKAGLKRAAKARPAAFMHRDRQKLITIGNFDDDLPKIAEADWVVEAVLEKPDIKRSLWERVEKVAAADAIISSNSSGIPMRMQTDGRSAEFKKRFLGTHFFNPPRYLHLLELIPLRETLPDVVEQMRSFGDRVLGKGVVIANDVPGFIANRIAAQSIVEIFRATVDLGLGIDEVDALMGPLVGRPKSAIFRTNDITGIDIMKYVAENLSKATGEDFTLPPFVDQLVERNWLGDKTGHGFYKKTKDEKGKRKILTLNLQTFEYEDKGRVNLPELEPIQKLPTAIERYKALLELPGKIGDFMRRTTYSSLHYAGKMHGVVADSVFEIDNGMKWGYGMEIGSFELCDALGIGNVVAVFKENGWDIPEVFAAKLSEKENTFYPADAPPPRAEGVLMLKDVRRYKKNILRSLKGASLLDIGDGVALLEFHSPANTLGEDAVQLALESRHIVAKNFAGLVVGNQQDKFSAGAFLAPLLQLARSGNWDDIAKATQSFQQMMLTFRYSPFPVVAAPFNMTLGGGCELCLWSNAVQAHAELYMGLVEAGVGLIPAGGGTTEMLIRFTDATGTGPNEFDGVRKAFELISMAKVSTSALEARSLGFLNDQAEITMNQDRLIADAKQRVLGLAPNYKTPEKRMVRVLGDAAFANLKTGIYLMHEAKYITDYEVHLATTLAKVLSGGTLNHAAEVSEDYLLELEREAFLQLCGQEKTQERIEYMLKNRKPLRN